MRLLPSTPPIAVAASRPWRSRGTRAKLAARIMHRPAPARQSGSRRAARSIAKGTGSTGGFHENSPPYKNSDSCEFQRYPSATAGGPEGCGKPFKSGAPIFHVLDKSMELKSLFHVFSVWVAAVESCPP